MHSSAGVEKSHKISDLPKSLAPSGKTGVEWHHRQALGEVPEPPPHPRHCERSEAIQSPWAERFWIASLRSQ
jgi:hypothetical protein